MDDLRWLQRQLNELTDVLWKSEHYSRDLLENQKGASQYWNDSAAIAIRNRYLSPREEEDQKALNMLKMQKEMLVHELTLVESITNKNIHALELSSFAIHELENSKTELRNAESSLSACARNTDHSEGELASVDTLLNQADQADARGY
uniref:Uncharacterized protein n=1 Tax=Candidatus Kentrum sp. LPFa TaxID=2126335 RepID=A0A450WDE2_9GAMM|nr:MAG: hypothetical protein BECKLPF1236B_GA0070989_10723 [Candidatus Kentron sp. LPFa]